MRGVSRLGGREDYSHNYYEGRLKSRVPTFQEFLLAASILDPNFSLHHFISKQSTNERIIKLIYYSFFVSAAISEQPLSAPSASLPSTAAVAAEDLDVGVIVLGKEEDLHAGSSPDAAPCIISHSALACKLAARRVLISHRLAADTTNHKYYGLVHQSTLEEPRALPLAGHFQV